MCVYVLRECVRKILCLEDQVLIEAFVFSHRLIPGPCNGRAKPRSATARPQPFISGPVLALISPLFPSIYPLMTVAILSLHLSQSDAYHRCPPDPGYTTR